MVDSNHTKTAYIAIANVFKKRERYRSKRKTSSEVLLRLRSLF